MSRTHQAALLEDVRSLFYHGFGSYMDHAFPEDELRPLSCRGSGSDRANSENLGINDVCGDYSLTLIDSLDMLPIMGDQIEFERAVRAVIETVTFDVNSKVQIFEVTIRILGGLLSAHQYATLPHLNATIKGYNNELLELALDLGQRLLPAFESPTGIPYPRINLKYGMHGILANATTETCAAGAGSLLLEFALLSRLSGQSIFEAVAKRAFKAIWDRRLDLGLVGNTIDASTGLWTNAFTSVGAGVDSFYEYALKAWILFGDEFYLSVWEQSQQSIAEFVADEEGYTYRNIHVRTGFVVSHFIDSLSAFYPGLLVLAGKTEDAIKAHLVYQALWTRFSALPERFNMYKKQVEVYHYPLRPEFIESTYYLYRATKDPFYLSVGQQVLDDLKALRQPCGFAGIQNVILRTLDDRMESFMLSETLKYLYLLFNDAHQLNHLDSNWVFTTEGHPFFLDRYRTRIEDNKNSSAKVNDYQMCPVSPEPGFYSIIMSRDDFSYTRYKVASSNNSTELPAFFPHHRPDSISTVRMTTTDFEILFGTVASSVLNASANIVQFGRDLVIKSLQGLKFAFANVGEQYIVSRIGRLRLKSGAAIYIQDPAYEMYNTADLVRFSKTNVTTRIKAYGPDAIVRHVSGSVSIHGTPLPEDGLMLDLISMLSTTNAYGCTCPAILGTRKLDINATAILINRGKCSFSEKTINAHGAARLIIVLDENPSPQSIRPILLDSTGAPLPRDENYPSMMIIQGSEQAAILKNTQRICLSSRLYDANVINLVIKGQPVDNVVIDSPAQQLVKHQCSDSIA